MDVASLQKGFSWQVSVTLCSLESVYMSCVMYMCNSWSEYIGGSACIVLLQPKCSMHDGVGRAPRWWLCLMENWEGGSH